MCFNRFLKSKMNDTNEIKLNETKTKDGKKVAKKANAPVTFHKQFFFN